MSIAVDSSLMVSVTSSASNDGYFTGLQKGTVLKSSSPTSLSYQFVYSTDEPEPNEYYDGALTGNVAPSSSLSQMVLDASHSLSSSSVNSVVQESGVSSSLALASNTKLAYLVGGLLATTIIITGL